MCDRGAKEGIKVVLSCGGRCISLPCDGREWFVCRRSRGRAGGGELSRNTPAERRVSSQSGSFTKRRTGVWSGSDRCRGACEVAYCSLVGAKTLRVDRENADMQRL